MRYSFATASLAAVVAARNWVGVDTEWATHPDKTADWYKEHGEALPKLAPTITTVEANKSYVVKLECLGCPFRVRELYEVVETWQEPPQDNSLLLNFTIDDEVSALLLNGDRIADLAPMPLNIYAFQTPANLSAETMDKMTSMQMLDSSFDLGTKFGRFELQYEHAVVGTREFGKNWVQIDVTGVHQRSMQNPGSYRLNKQGQMMVQVLLREKITHQGVQKPIIEDIQVVERKSRVQPYKMNCGKLAIIKTEFNPLEWDYYGKIGTWTRTWHMLLWKTGHFFDAQGLVIIIFVVIAGTVALIRRRMGRQQNKTVAQASEDAEAALLGPEYEDAPPEYEDVSELDGKEKE